MKSVRTCEQYSNISKIINLILLKTKKRVQFELYAKSGIDL